MAYGVKPPPLGEWIVNLGEAAEYMFDHNIFQNPPRRRRFLRDDGEGNESRSLGEGPKNSRRPTQRTTVIQYYCRYMMPLNLFEGEFYRADAAGQPLHARDVLFDGICLHVHPSTTTGRCRHRAVDLGFHSLHGARLLRYYLSVR